MTIRIKKDRSGNETKVSYIDYDEIDSLIKGIDYLSKIKKSITKLQNFEATYETNGNLKITTYNDGNRIRAAVSSGYAQEVTAYYLLSSLSDIKKVLKKAKQKIDSIKDK